MYKLISNAKDSDDLSIGYHCGLDGKKQEMTNSKNRIRKYHPKNMLRDVFRFAEHHEKATFGLGYKLTLTSNKDDGVIDKVAGIADARNNGDHIHWLIAHYTLSFQQQGFLSKQILIKTPTELRYIEISVFLK